MKPRIVLGRYTRVKSVPKDISGLIWQMLALDPKSRLSVDEVRNGLALIDR
jgi:hypothetical protein